jgi:hypothetical protein
VAPARGAAGLLEYFDEMAESWQDVVEALTEVGLDV